jgi:hypothetical protein
MCSDSLLHTLQQLRDGEITTDYCINIIMVLLQPYPDFLERFSKIVEIPPPPQSRHSAVASDPFLDTVVKFDAWPGG